MAEKRRYTYSKRNRSFANAEASPSLPSSPSSSPVNSKKRSREPLEDDLECEQPTNKKVCTFKTSLQSNAKTQTRGSESRKPLKQLFLSLSSKSSLTSCNTCNLSYTRGVPEDEDLHRSHCARVQKGTEWSREDERESKKAGGSIVKSRIELSSGQHGRIISLRATGTGKIWTKLETIMSTINFALSSPPLTQEALAASKVYLFLLAPSKGTSKERIVGCVVAQRIHTALEVVREKPVCSSGLVCVDQGVYCNPQPLPATLGISRIFVAKDCRRKGIAQSLLDSATKTFIHGCHIDPCKGQVAFSQPTSAGQKLMESWGKGAIRIFEE